MQQVDSKLPFKLVYSLGEHPYLGFLIEPHIVQLNPNGQYSLSYKRIFTNTIGDFASALDDTDYYLIKQLDEIEQTSIIKRYHKKAIRPVDFFGKVFDQKIYDYIRPKIDQKILMVLEKIGDKPLFLMSKDGYPADQELHIADEPTSVLFHFRRNEIETRYFPTLKYKGNRLDFMYKGAQVIVNKQAWLLVENTLYHFDQAIDGKKLSPFLNKRYIAVPRATEKRYFETFVTGLIEKHHVYAEGFDIRTHREDAKPLLKLFYTEPGDSSIQLSFAYGPYEFTAGTDHPITVRLEHQEQEDHYVFHRIKRSLVWEQKQASFIEQLGLRKKDVLFGNYVLDDPGSSIIDWLNLHQEELLSKGFSITQAKGDKRIFIGRTTLEIAVEEGNDWFDIKAFAHFGPYAIPFVELREHILNKEREFVLPNGEIAIIPEEWFAQYEHLFQFATKKDGLKLSKTHVGLLYEATEHISATFHHKLERLLDFKQIEEAPLPSHFRGALRPYQRAGYNWFYFLQSYKFGGCLADDMGLGKTVQTLALLQQQKEALKDGEQPKTSLLILPTSLIYNWQREAEKFAPQLRILLHTGNNRVKDAFGFSHFDLVITTYGIVRSDTSLLASFFFNYIILDESQHIKNPGSKSFKSIKSLKSKHKLALSGTPIENSVADIWTQMHFTNPGLLGSYSYFQKEFVTPIEKKKDETKALRLQAMVKPFILRRTKDQVAQELPPKTEQTIFCEMSEEQLALYESTKSEYRNAFLDGTMQNGKGNQIMLLQGLTKLRQIANHPSMLQESQHIPSGKFDAVIEMLDSISAEGHKVLIFSQFVKHLQLFKAYFDSKKTPYAYLDGSTRDRSEPVTTFKENSSIKIFLISIKAGGVGLNLTEADYVFILDPWWNPAVEQQAIDRSHRIGQTKNVFIYKFISKDTVEEKILALQNRKKALSTALIKTEESFIKSLSSEDIHELLR
ncbi:helicase-like protein [Sphingobacterium allocomposti]|uniref:Helicase-like protein n=1 Tax=Sphingobacterium allocomposti TaxID=415956 RepID=A0A5S5DK12_9SPHI|nr:DEAD/DEAH box helicase [Sphingobacterium composti Yoo et al. 2007 non Ten et al. 2007]TYP95954.1 helicase-like protein [Sphingobacterium composti Yoo et al. 2007 non Ten et al. 2007]